MELSHPLDEAIRARIKAARPNQAEFAAKIGRSAGWLNKYMHGAGNATLDDVVRMLALLNGVEGPALSGTERRLLKAWRAIPLERQEDAIAVLENVARGYRRVPSQESAAPAARTQRQTKNPARESRKAAEG